MIIVAAAVSVRRWTAILSRPTYQSTIRKLDKVTPYQREIRWAGEKMRVITDHWYDSPYQVCEPLNVVRQIWVRFRRRHV
jgi:hypothetical protein